MTFDTAGANLGAGDCAAGEFYSVAESVVRRIVDHDATSIVVKSRCDKTMNVDLDEFELVLVSVKSVIASKAFICSSCPTRVEDI